MPSKVKDEVVIHLAGHQHSHWTNYRISSDLMIPADAWQMQVGIPGPRPSYVRAWADIKVTMNNELVLTGRIDSIGLRGSKKNRDLSLNGRDLMGVLVDCSAPIYFALDLNLEEIVARLVRPLGTSKINVQGSGSRAKISVQPGMRVWDALQEACEAAGVWAWFDPDGTLVVGGPDYDAPPVAELIYTYDGKHNNVIDLNVSHDIRRQYSQVTVLGQSAGGSGGGRVVDVSGGADQGQAWESDKGQNAIKASVQDSRLISLGINRPLIVVDGNCTQLEAQRKARKLLADGQMEAFSITVLVHGHRTSDGLLWTPGQRVHVYSEPDRIKGVYFMTARDFVGGKDSGQTTQLTLKPDKTWLPELARQNKSRSNQSGGAGRIVDVS